MFQKLKNIYHLLQAVIANIYYGFPSKKIKVIGITGTDGKTTTTHLTYHILKTVGKKVAMISTVYAKVGDKEYDTGLHTTTPSSFLIQKLIKEAVKSGQEYFILETTSHGLDQNRVWGINYEIGLITNITHEHLDYHRNYQLYVKAKEKLLRSAKTGIINDQEEYYQYLSDSLKQKCQSYMSYMKFFEKNEDLTNYNKKNYAAAFAIAKQVGLLDEKITKAIKNFVLPKGRLETVYDRSFKIIIDFAHTPNAFLNLLLEIKKITKGKVIHVFGAAGLRDSSKRRAMGQASEQYSDIIILTEEDYRTEDINKIFDQIEEGILDKRKVKRIINRQEAINQAILLAKPQDTIIITGKSHEKSLCRGNKEYPWNEHQAVSKGLEMLKK